MMRLTRRCIAILAAGAMFILGSAGPAAAQDGETAGAETPTIAIEGRWLFFNLDGSTKVTDTDLTGRAIRGTTVGFADEYDLDTSVAAPEVAIELDVIADFGVIGSYLEVGTDGDTVLQEDVVVDGKTYNAGDYVSDALDLRYGKLLMRWNLIENFFGLSVGPMVGAGYVRFDQEVERIPAGMMTPETSHETGRMTMPQLGAMVHWAPVDWFFIDAELSGGWLAYDGDRGAWGDATLGLAFVPVSQIAIGGGIRFLHIDLEKVELDSDFAWAAGRFSLFGVYIGLEIRL
jgi:hypothetical protein